MGICAWGVARCVPPSEAEYQGRRVWTCWFPGVGWREEPVRIEDLTVVAPNPFVFRHEAVDSPRKYVLWAKLSLRTQRSNGQCILRECNILDIHLALSPHEGFLNTSGNRGLNGRRRRCRWDGTYQVELAVSI